MLEVLGLEAVSELIYREMLQHPEWGVTELVAGTGLSETEVRDALDRLAALTLLRASRETPGTLRPVNPEVGLAVLVSRQEAELARRRQEIVAGQAAVAALLADVTAAPDPAAYPDAERLVGLDAIQSRLEALAGGAKTELLSVAPGAGQRRETLEASRDLDSALLRRGVRMRTLAQDSMRTSPHTVAYSRWMIEGGAQIRTSPVLPPRMVIVDRACAMVPLDPADTSKGAVQVAEPGVVTALVALFEHAWERAVPLDAPAADPQPQDGPTDADRELLKLMAAGVTDEAAANRLGVSLRTVRRRIADLMERLGATSRFDAGLKAGRRGWL
ncbi:DNA-binding CsgD family transcriptional regulator/sugar-specific transcriptional regulator TrmB [Catenulispora sp. GAS73]|uniref:LuxR C-terminal-related transcriptional regulator n=1 Tax=Catenulispora sp. GAS73 TaxID=3156269 RepID=UPI0035112D07